MKTESKDEVWRNKRAEIDTIADKLGTGIDEGIKDTVTAFQVFAINTTGSHEGKLDRYPVPYVDVECKNIYELKERLESAKGDEERNAVLREMIEGNFKERKKIALLLEEFYRDREVAFETKLHVNTLARGWSRIESQAADLQDYEIDQDLIKKRLRDFQQEMQAFTDFLKKKFFT